MLSAPVSLGYSTFSPKVPAKERSAVQIARRHVSSCLQVLQPFGEQNSENVPQKYFFVEHHVCKCIELL
jgi:hypothetical protein